LLLILREKVRVSSTQLPGRFESPQGEQQRGHRQRQRGLAMLYKRVKEEKESLKIGRIKKEKTRIPVTRRTGTNQTRAAGVPVSLLSLTLLLS